MIEQIFLMFGNSGAPFPLLYLMLHIIWKLGPSQCSIHKFLAFGFWVTLPKEGKSQGAGNQEEGEYSEYSFCFNLVLVVPIQQQQIQPSPGDSSPLQHPQLRASPQSQVLMYLCWSQPHSQDVSSVVAASPRHLILRSSSLVQVYSVPHGTRRAAANERLPQNKKEQIFPAINKPSVTSFSFFPVSHLHTFSTGFSY